MKQTNLHLRERDRELIETLRHRGVFPVRAVNRAHVLAALDDAVEEKAILAVLGISRACLWQIRARYRKEGLDGALREKARPGQPVKYGAKVQAELTALACSAPPKGQKRWTVRSLGQSLIKTAGLKKISRETVRLLLKKTS